MAEHEAGRVLREREVEVRPLEIRLPRRPRAFAHFFLVSVTRRRFSVVLWIDHSMVCLDSVFGVYFARMGMCGVLCGFQWDLRINASNRVGCMNGCCL